MVLIEVLASVNTLTEAGAVIQSPRLILINGGGCPNLPTSVMSLIEEVGLMKPSPLNL